MSSEHAIIIARNTETGAIELPLDDLTLYSTSDYGIDNELGGPGSTKSIIDSVSRRYTDEWIITLYVRKGADYCGSR